MDEVVVLSIPQIIITFVAAMGIPSALTSYMLSRHEKRLEKRDEQSENARKYVGFGWFLLLCQHTVCC